MMKVFTLFVLFLGLNSFASEIELVWRKIDTQYFYKDLNQQCTTKTFVGNTHTPGEAYLTLELLDGKINGARFSNYPNIFPFKAIYKAIELDASEIATIELFLDKKNQYWVKAFTLSERLAKWLIYFPSQRNACKIPFIPKLLSTSLQSTTFETEGLEQGIEVSYSDWVTLTGEYPDGAPFEERIRLVQRKDH